MGRHLTRAEAIATVERGDSVAQVLDYVVGTGAQPSTFVHAWVSSTPRSGYRAEAIRVEDVGDGTNHDITWFPEVDPWEPELTPDGTLLNGPVPRELTFATAEEAFAHLESTHGVSPDRWRHHSMVGDDYLAARR